MAIPDETDVAWFDEVRAGAASGSFEDGWLGELEVAAARNYFEMECLVRALDSMETIASSEGLAKEYVQLPPPFPCAQSWLTTHAVRRKT
jgi:nuclear pore complex protein Nup107